MNRLAGCLLGLWLLVHGLQAQPVTSPDDLQRLDQILRRTPSFRAQLRGARRTEYADAFRRAEKQLPKVETAFERFYWLSQLVAPINDNHISFYRKPDQEFDYARYQDSSYVRAFRASQPYRDYPRSTLALDSLEAALKTRSADSLEGIYYYRQALKIGVYRTSRRDSVVGVVLVSYLPIWSPGDVSFLLRETAPHRFWLYSIHPWQKGFAFYRHEKLLNRSLKLYGITKALSQPDYGTLPDSLPKFFSRRLRPDVLYVRLGDFMVNPVNRRRSEAFYVSLKDSLTTSELIVDVRNNPGGYFTISRPYLKLIRRYARRHPVHLLVNHQTVSNAEEFVIRLMHRKNVRLYGETTQGMITYGSNYGKTFPLATPNLFIYPTDMRGVRRDLQYETTGITPEVALRPDTDWLEQLLLQASAHRK